MEDDAIARGHRREANAGSSFYRVGHPPTTVPLVREQHGTCRYNGRNYE